MRPVNPPFTSVQYLLAWGVHLFTGLGAALGLFTLNKIHEQDYVFALWLMAITIFIDAVDGSLARLVHVKKILPGFDGALLDNIVDYLNYVITPCFFLMAKPDMLPQGYEYLVLGIVAITSAYQFCQSDAKTPDHFFKGFPCYWNIALFYMFIFNTSASLNMYLLLLFSVLIFVPIKYVYPSRLDYLTDSKTLKIIMHLCSIIFGIASVALLFSYPEKSPFFLALSFGYVIMYMALSSYRTFCPMIKAKMSAKKR